MDRLTFRCPNCGVSLSVPLEYAGKQGTCKGCGETITAPVQGAPIEPEPQPGAGIAASPSGNATGATPPERSATGEGVEKPSARNADLEHRTKAKPAPGAAPTEVEGLISVLQSGDEQARASAAVKLHKHLSDAVVRALTCALSDASWEVRNNAAESLRVMVVQGLRKLDPAPLVEALKREPKWVSLRSCLRELGMEGKLEEVTRVSFPNAPKYSKPCMPFGCPECGMQITRVPSWPARGNSVPFYAQNQLDRRGVYHIELACPACNKQVFVVWDMDPR